MDSCRYRQIQLTAADVDTDRGGQIRLWESQKIEIQREITEVIHTQMLAQDTTSMYVKVDTAKDKNTLTDADSKRCK